MNLPIEFIERMSKQLGAEYPSFEKALNEKSPISRRWNRRKLLPKLDDRIAWCPTAEFLSERPVFTLDPLLHAGAYYVQEASSMMINFAINQTIDISNSLKVMDLCAAPGGKSTLLADIISKDSLLFSNEVIKSRVNILKENIIKWGTPNIAISNHEAEELSVLENFFDLVLIDAPCSGEGLFRKDVNATNEWSIENVALCSARQRKIVANAEKCLKDDGLLLYSTCTYNDDENLKNVQWITKNFDFESICIEELESFGVSVLDINGIFGYQCFPHKVKGEGFFFSILKKKKNENTSHASYKKFRNLDKLSKNQEAIVQPFLTNDNDCTLFLKKNNMIVAIPNSILDSTLSIENRLQRLGVGVEIGEIKGKDFVPSHDLAMSLLVSNNLPKVELPKEDALSYLRKNNFILEETQKGWTLMTYQNLNLGWAKLLPNRINNYYPQEWRIRMQ